MPKTANLARLAVRAAWQAWNPVTGCTKISPGCASCYAERLALRMQAEGQPSYARGFDLALHEARLDLPTQWSTPKWIAVNSMSDLFHEDVPVEFIRRVLRVIEQTPWHQYLILTKRSRRLANFSQGLAWPDNAWLGVSIESDAFLERLADLRRVPAKNHVAVFEPLLGPVDGFDPLGLAWVHAGCETGPYARPCLSAWIRALREVCRAAGVPFHEKQAATHRTEAPPLTPTLGVRKAVAPRLVQAMLF